MAPFSAIGGTVTQTALQPCLLRLLAGRPQSHSHDRERAVPRGPRAAGVASKEACLESAVEGEASACLSEACRQATFGSASGDQIQEVDADVKGYIPSWVEGTLFVNGASYIEAMKHMFDGYAVVQKWRIGDGQVRSSHKFLETVAYTAYRESGQMKFNEFGTHLPGDGLGRKIKDIWSLLAGLLLNRQSFTDNASVNIVSVGQGKLLATSESKHSHYIVDPSTLEMQSQPLVDSKVKENLATAHHTKLSDGDLINVGTAIGEGFVIQRTNPRTMKCTAIRSLPAQRPAAPSWIHDFPATDDCVVIVEQPIYYNLGSLAFGQVAEHVVFDWVPEDGTRFHIVPLDPSKKVRTFSTPTFFAFHYGNTFVSEDGKRLCFDVSRYEDPQIVNDLLLENLRPGENEVSQSSLWRYELPLDGPDGGEVTGRCLAPGVDFMDFLSFNKEYKGKANRFTYGISVVRPTCAANALCKVDAETGTFAIWHEPGTTPGEPHFVPRPSGDGEDDGIILSTVTGSDGLSFLLFLDGKTFKEVARAKLPYSMPCRFHGEFVPAEAA